MIYFDYFIGGEWVKVSAIDFKSGERWNADIPDGLNASPWCLRCESGPSLDIVPIKNGVEIIINGCKVGSLRRKHSPIGSNWIYSSTAGDQHWNIRDPHVLRSSCRGFLTTLSGNFQASFGGEYIWELRLKEFTGSLSGEITPADSPAIKVAISTTIIYDLRQGLDPVAGG